MIFFRPSLTFEDAKKVFEKMIKARLASLELSELQNNLQQWSPTQESR